MDKSKASLIASITFVATTGMVALLCANAHIDFFPCKTTPRNSTQAQDSTCSLMDHLRDANGGEKDELTGAGWAMLIAFCVGIGIADSALIYTVLSRKSAPTA